MNLLEFENVHAAYNSARVLHDVTFAIATGEKVSILGRNGVGKTTLVNTCLGIAELKSGAIYFANKKVKKFRAYGPACSGIAVVPQGRWIIPKLSVKENLLLGAAPGRKGKWTLDSVYRLFPILKERADGLGTAMSGGQQQMLAIARGLMSNPSLLILDEPSEGLAPVVVDELANTLNEVVKTGTGVLLIEQNIKLVQKTTDRYYVLAKGAVVEQGSLTGLSTEALKKHITV